MKKISKLMLAGCVGFILSNVISFCYAQAPEAPVKEEKSRAKEVQLITIENAVKAVSATGQDILVDFCGSDWCGWCQKLDKEVFSTDKWKKEAPKKYLLVILDFPRADIISPEQKEYNNKIGADFGIEGYPTVMVLDSKGKPYAKTGYKDGGPEKYLAHLENFAAQKSQRDELLNKASAAATDTKIALLTEAITLFNKWEIGFGYPELKEEVVSLDADNKQGSRLKYAIELAQYFQKKANPGKVKEYLEMIKKINPDKSRNVEIGLKIHDIEANNKKNPAGALEELQKLFELKPDGETTQAIYYYMAQIYYSQKNQDKTIESLEKALEAAPKSELSAQIKDILANQKRRRDAQQKPAPK